MGACNSAGDRKHLRGNTGWTSYPSLRILCGMVHPDTIHIKTAGRRDMHVITVHEAEIMVTAQGE